MLKELAEQNQDAGDVQKALERRRIVFVPHAQTTKHLQRPDQMFNLEPAAVAAKSAAFVPLWTAATLAMRRDQFDAAVFQAFAQQVAVSRPVVEQMLRHTAVDHDRIQRRFHQTRVGHVGGCRAQTDGQAAGFADQFDLRTFADSGANDSFGISTFRRMNSPEKPDCQRLHGCETTRRPVNR